MSTLMPTTISPPQFSGVARETWLWQPYIPFGKITLLVGDPGLGKSFLALDLAARLSRNLPMPTPLVPRPSGSADPTCTPNGSSAPKHLNPNLNPVPNPTQDSARRIQDFPAHTILLSAEDELHDTIHPRLRALNADLD